MELLLQQTSLASRLRWHQDLMQSGVDLTKRQNNFIRCDVKVGREGRRDCRGHILRMDDLGIKAG